MEYEDEYFDLIGKVFSDKSRAKKNIFPYTFNESMKALEISSEFLDLHPCSPDLWEHRGSLLQGLVYSASRRLDNHQLLEEAFACHNKAIVLDPEFAEAYESVGDFHDCWNGDFVTAEKFYRKALEFKSLKSSYYRLARSLALQGRKEEALEVVSPKYCEFHQEDQIVEIRNEISDGFWLPE